MNIPAKRALTLALNFATIISTSLLYGQSLTFETGRPFITNFSPKQYHAEAQNWDIAQDSKGLLYFGNSGGVLQFDGNQWQLIKLSNESSALALAIGNDDIIYVGGQGDFGFIAPDSTGVLSFNSLVGLIPEENKDFEQIRQVRIIENVIYFQSIKGFYKYDGQSISVIKPENTITPTIAFHYFKIRLANSKFKPPY